MSRNGLYGITMRPCSTTLEGNEKTMMSSDYSVAENFREAYCRYMGAMDVVTECAKVFIMKNWDKVSDYSELNVNIQTGVDTFIDYFNNDAQIRRELAWEKEREKMDAERLNDGKKYPQRVKSANLPEGYDPFKELKEMDKLRHNPVVTFGEVYLDPSDGDFGVSINGVSYYLRDDQAIIKIADYIESKLKNIEITD